MILLKKIEDTAANSIELLGINKLSRTLSVGFTAALILANRN